jgi:hypothetical protein
MPHHRLQPSCIHSAAQSDSFPLQQDIRRVDAAPCSFSKQCPCGGPQTLRLILRHVNERPNFRRSNTRLGHNPTHGKRRRRPDYSRITSTTPVDTSLHSLNAFMQLPGRAGRSFAPLPSGPLGRQARELGLLRTKQHPARDRRLRHARRFHTWTATTRGALFWLRSSKQAASQASLCFGCHVDD